ECPPRVYQPEARRVCLLLGTGVGDRVDDRAQLADELLVGGADLVEVPGPADQRGGPRGTGGVAGGEPLVPQPRLGEQRLDLLVRPDRHPGVVVAAAVPEEAQALSQASPDGARAARVEHDEVEGAVP